MTEEQKARDMLERIGIENAQEINAGSLVELANMISSCAKYGEKNRQSPILEFFDFSSLEGNAKDVSETIHDIAHCVDEFFPKCAETSAGLRKLLEAKDCFVRAASR